LALCCLKTGQPSESRDLLEDVLRRAPDHRRAWGYLGLSFERLGEYAKALSAFERADQPHLARRMQQLIEDLKGLQPIHALRDRSVDLGRRPGGGLAPSRSTTTTETECERQTRGGVLERPAHLPLL
jgi:tetratricopeptide (TPR) repeat protein